MYVSLGKTTKKNKPKVLQNHTLKIGTRHSNLCSFDIQYISMYSEAFQSFTGINSFKAHNNPVRKIGQMYHMMFQKNLLGLRRVVWLSLGSRATHVATPGLILDFLSCAFTDIRCWPD